MCRIAPIAALSLALAACGSEPSAPAAQEGASAVAPTTSMLMPGKYKVTMKVNNVSFPNAKGPMADKAKGMFGATGHSREICLTPEEAKKGYEAFHKRTAQGNCNYERFDASAGKIDAVMVCQTGRGMTARTELNGEFSPTGSRLTMKTKSEVPGAPGGGMSMDAEVVSERIGDCT